MNEKTTAVNLADVYRARGQEAEQAATVDSALARARQVTAA